MKQVTFRRLMTSITPDAPEHFSNHVDTVLGRIVAQEESQMKESTKRALYMGGRFSSRALIFALIAVLALGTVAFAATQWNIFGSLSEMLGTQPPTADSVMQGNLHTETVNGVEITIQEAVYDGRTLFLQYSYRLPGYDMSMGQVSPKTGERLISDEELDLLSEYNVGWWVDAFWVNGQPMDMASNSGSNDRGSEVPGEIVHTEYWRLDNLDVELTGKVEIALPIGESKPAEYRKAIFDKASGQYTLPDQGVVTFTVDTKDILSRVVTLNPNQETVTPGVTAKVTEAAFTPLMTYITLDMQPNPDSVAAYKAEHGEGFYGEDGTLLWEYSGMYVYGEWLMELQLVDGNGTPLFAEPTHGCNGYNDTWAEFTYPYMDPANLPDELWLAPMDGDTADMEYAIRVK